MCNFVISWQFNGKGKFVFVHTMKRRRGSRGRTQVILNPGIDGGDGSSSRFGRFTVGTSRGTH